MSPVVVRTYHSATTRVVFNVSREPCTGALSCTCKEYRFYGTGTCRHIKRLRAEPDPLASLDWVTESAGESSAQAQ